MNESTKRTLRKLRVAPTPALERAKRLYGWVWQVGCLATFVCLVLGIWVDWRWLATAVVPLLGWVLSHQATDLLDAELERRRTEADGCPDRLG